MSILFHHLHSEYRIHAKVMWFTLAVLLVMCYALSIDASSVESVQIIWYSLVAGMVTSSAYKKDFSIKYYASMPIPRDILILIIILGRVIYFIPGAVTLTVYYSALPKDPLFNHSWPLFILTYFIFISLFNAIQVLGDIENPRIESVPGRFESFLMFFKKIAINYVLGAALLVGGFLLLRGTITALQLDFLNNQFLLIIYGGSLLTFMMYRCHQVFLNESLSYWSWKRDGVLATLFIIAAVIPAVVYKKKLAQLVYHKGDSPYFLAINEENISEIKKLHLVGHDFLQKNELGYTPFLAAIRKGNIQVLKELQTLGAKINSDDLVMPSLMGQYRIDGKLSPVHLAVLSTNPAMLDFIFQDPSVTILAQSEQVKLAPLHLAAQQCIPTMIEPLIGYGAPLDLRSNDGSSAIFEAVKSSCYAAAVELSMLGADLELKDNKGKTVFDYATNPQMNYLLSRFSRKKMPLNRFPASSNLAFPSTKR